MYEYPMMFPVFYPRLPLNNDLPPTLYSILNSIANFDNETQTKIKDLAKVTRSDIFDFEYPLTPNISKEDFEVTILNHFLMRRIGYDTVTAFQIALSVRLNEIMPRYNKLFDMLDGWNLFTSGEVIDRTLQEAKQKVDTNTGSTSTTSSNIISSTDNVQVSNTNTSDRRYSKMPENDLTNVKDGKYVTDYNYDTTTDNNATNNTSNTNNSLASNISNSNTNNVSDNNTVHETISHTPSDKIRIYNEFIENKNNIYTMIFNDLDRLFYGLV